VRDETPIACSLPSESIEPRLDEWRSVVSSTRHRESTETGVRLHFGRDADVVSIARLAAAEQMCCGFLAFTLTIDADGVVLDVNGPPDARAMIDGLFGVARARGE